MKDNILPKRLRELREEKGYLQKFVADKIGVRSNTLSGYENGTRSPDPEMIKKLADLYGVTTDYLLGHEVKDIDSMSDEEIDDEIKEIMKEVNVWYKDEPENKREKLEMLRKIIKTFTEDD